MAEVGDDYDPYTKREVEHPMSNFGALTNVIKALVGTGILAAPMAFRNAGWVNGIVGTFVIAFIVVYAKQILLFGMYEIEKRKRVPLLTYSEALAIAAEEGPPALRCIKGLLRISVDIMLVFFHFGACCVYVVFMSDCLKFLGDYYWTEVDKHIYMAALAVPLCLIYLLPDLRALVPYTAAANVVLLFGFGTVFYYMFTNLKPFSEMVAFQEISTFPLFVGTTLFAFDAPGLIVSVEANMKNPRAYLGVCGVLSQSLLIAVIIQVVFAFFGYWRYAEEIKPAILQNLPPGAIVTTITELVFAFSIFISHPLQGYVPIDVIWYKWLKAKAPEKWAFKLELVFRICLAILSVLVAIGCPNLTTILSFVGAFCLSLLGLILPAVLHLCVKYETGYGPAKIHLILDLLLILVGLVGVVIGLWIPINEILSAKDSK